MTFSNNITTTKQLPVIIVGAGPCGLVAALALKKYGVPFVIVEKASRSKISSNAGSGFELAPTAVEILRNRLGIDISKIISYYRGMRVITSAGKTIRHSELAPDYEGGSVNRSEMQNYMLDLVFPSVKDEEGVLFCGSGLESYSEYGAQGNVVATLASGETITGCVLLACDGIHSRVRGVLHGGYDSSQDWATNVKVGNAKDPLHFCNTMVYWGKTPLTKGSALEQEFSKTQKTQGKKKDPCVSFVFSLTTLRAPASFFFVPSNHGSMLNWAVTIYSETPEGVKNNNGKDLTRRGGGPLSEEEKKRLFDFQSHGRGSESVVRGIKDFPLAQLAIEETPAGDITEAGLYDREHLDVPFTSESKLVALLGDSAHPQTPLLGQGVNMAITDAYVYATNIAVALKSKNKSVKQAITDSDTELRRTQAKSIVSEARFWCNVTTSQNVFFVFFNWLVLKFIPTNEFMNQLIQTDKSNKEYLLNLDENQCSLKQQESLMQ